MAKRALLFAVINVLVLFLLTNISFAATADFFGMNINRVTDFPTVSFKDQRLWDAGVSWAQIETSKGVYSWTLMDKWVNQAQVNGIAVMYVFGKVPTWASSNPSIPECVSGQPKTNCCGGGAGWCAPPSNLQDMDDFVKALVARYGTKITSYELWNEPNNYYFWSGTVSQLVTVTKRLHDDLRSLAPGAKLVSPSGSTSYMQSYWNNGGTQDYDVVSTHNYTGANGNVPEIIAKRISDLRTMLSSFSGLANKPIWATEGGWGKNINMPDADMQAGFVARYYLMHLSAGVARFYWYAWDTQDLDNLWDSYGNNGCTNTSGCVNKAGVAYQQVYNWLVGSSMPNGCTLNNTTYTCNLTLADGTAAQAIWDTSLSCSNGTCATTPYLVNSKFTVYDDLAGTTHMIQNSSVPVGDKPILVRAPVAPLAIQTASLSTASVGAGYSATITSTGGTAPYRYSVASGALPAGITLSSSGSISGQPTKAGHYDFGIKVTDSAGRTSTKSFTILVSHLINAGGPAYSGPTGGYWLSGATCPANSHATSTTTTISNTTAQPLYQSECYGLTFSYSIPVANGTYEVRLKFAETFSKITAAGQRLFNAAINGTPVLTNFDIFAAAGGSGIAVDKAFTVSVTGGSLNLSFTASVQNAKIDAIALNPQ